MYITFKGVRYEIPYDKDTLKLNRTIDSTFDSGYVVSVPLEANMTLDLSRRIPRNLLVEIEYDGRTFEFKTGETAVDKLTYASPLKYVHRINLASLTKDLTRKTLENMTLKQPKGDLGIYSRSVLRGSNETLGPEDESYHVVSFTPTINTNTSKTNGLTVVSLEEYKISNAMVFSYSPAIIDVVLEIVIKYNGTSIYTEEYTLKGSINPFQTIRKQYDATFNHTPTVVGNYSLEVRKKPTLASISVEVENISFSSK